MNTYLSDEQYQYTKDDDTVVHYYGYHQDINKLDYEDELYYECLEFK